MTDEFNDATIEYLVERITKEVLLMLRHEAQAGVANGNGEVCNHADGQCVSECKDNVQQVVQAGASRITAGLGHVPADEAVAGSTSALAGSAAMSRTTYGRTSAGRRTGVRRISPRSPKRVARRLMAPPWMAAMIRAIITRM